MLSWLIMIEDLPRLNLPTTDLQIEQKDDAAKIFDPVRRRMVTLTPEEWVRQHLIAYMTKVLGYPTHLMAVERTLKWQKLTKRCDIIVYNARMHPVLIAELKAPHIPLDQKVLNQAIRYNQAFHAPYLLLSNGMQHMVILIRTGAMHPISYLDNIPSYEIIKEE